MTFCSHIVNTLLETDDLSPEVIASLVHKAGNYSLFVPDPIPAKKEDWWVLIGRYRQDFDGQLCSQIPGSRWKFIGEWPTKEETDANAQLFLKQHGK